MNSIRGTFQHLSGISEKREAELWANGLFDWNDLTSSLPKQLELYRGRPNSVEKEIQESEKALEALDIDFFASRLPKRELHRVATSFPTKCVFLDIETTGLSSFYDTVTLVGWSVGDQYFTEVAPTNIDTLVRALDENPILITFNGSLFDLPFLSKHFGVDWSNYTHIDLRYLAKRVDLAGGQKKIEVELGLSRDDSLTGVDGSEAVALWFDYKEGSVEALKKLIQYNHADIEGMKGIFEAAVRGLKSPSSTRDLVGTSEVFPRSHIDFVKHGKQKQSRNTLRLDAYTGKVGPRLILSDLLRSEPRLQGAAVVGIDLTGSEKRASGWAMVRGDKTESRLILTDEELIEATLAAKPCLVSIDSPLSLPLGRTTEFDDDPGRDAYGIIRIAERELKKRGINSYPALLPSMQKLTARGIRLATWFREHGIPVIESYPGAAQDILGIPRKQKGLTYLKRGLARFGYGHEMSLANLSHDELDALTSALVGQFMLAGHWEGVGSDDEDYMIVPMVERNTEIGKTHLVVGISGALASGKTSSAKILERMGFRYCRFSQILEEELKRRKQPVTRATLQSLGIEMRNSRSGQRRLQLAIAAQTRGAATIVIDGLRHPEDHAFLFERWGFRSLHLHVDAPESLRRERFSSRNRDGDSELAKSEGHVVEESCSTLRRLAHQVIRNNGSLADLESLLKQCVENANAN